jgi:glycosyltransferase involved in cell wall biosynthesis
MSKPRVLFVARNRYRLPLAPGLAPKFEALARELDFRVLACGAPGSAGDEGAFVLVRPHRLRALDGVLFWIELPWRTAKLLRSFRPEAVICQSTYEGAAALVARRLARVPARIVVEVHGDWRAATRLYGSRARLLFARFADAVASAALRRADAVRTVSPFTAGLVRDLGVEPAADFPAYMELGPFVRPVAPLPERPTIVFVGVLEAYKNIDGLAEAWRLASARAPGASLRIVGDGSRVDIAEALVTELGVRWDRRLDAAGVADAMDDAWALVLPSRSEGMGRVIVEAFCRGRGVIGARAGSIPNLVEDDVSGVLVDPEDPKALAEALLRVMADRALAERLGAGAHAAAGPWLQSPDEYARSIRRLIA